MISRPRRVRTLAVLACLALIGCASGESVEPRQGLWRAWLDSPGGELPFGLELGRGADGWSAFLINGDEKIEVPGVELADGGLLLDIAHYDASVRASVEDGGRRLEGRWTKTAGPNNKTSTLPFHAVAGDLPRFPGGGAQAAGGVSGRWAVAFADEETPSVGVFDARPDGTLHGTFLNATGDYRYLEGSFADDRLRLSVFDGAHAFLFDARLQADGSLSGDFWSRDSWHDTWTARRDDTAALPDAFAQTTWVESDDPTLVFPDLDGTPRALDDPAFDGGAKLLQIFGTWCPNCNDATEYLVELDRRYRDRGLSIVGLAFEMTGDFERDSSQVRRYAEYRGIEFPVLLAGLHDKALASEAFPRVDRIRSFPTTVFLDGTGAVRAVHSGYSGPATGEAHARLRERFETLIETLLTEPGTG